MTKTQTEAGTWVLPRSSWDAYLDALRLLAEGRYDGPADRVQFLLALELVNDTAKLTESGKMLYDATFVLGDEDVAQQVLEEALLRYPPAMAILQLLSGARGISRKNVEAVLRSRGFLDTQPDRCIGSLLMLLDRTRLVDYSKPNGSVRAIWTPSDEPATPTCVFISRETPFGNRAWFRTVLRSCDEFVYWLDKHFLPAMFDDLWSSADGNAISEVRILSLYDPDVVTSRTLRLYTSFVRELSAKGIKVEWRVMDSQLVRDTHDRWVISATSAWNVPNANAILSGQNSEILRSESKGQLLRLFAGYWEKATHVLDVQDESEGSAAPRSGVD